VTSTSSLVDLLARRWDLALVAPRLIDDEPAGDGEYPRDDRRSRKEARPASVHVEQRLLHEVLGHCGVANVSAEEGVEPRRERIVDLAERCVVSCSVAIHRGIEGAPLHRPWIPRQPRR
jgi:hypothetical protein